MNYHSGVGWTIFTAIDLFVGALLLDLMTTSVPPAKLPRLRTARNISLILFAVTLLVLLGQVAYHRHWIGH